MRVHTAGAHAPGCVENEIIFMGDKPAASRSSVRSRCRRLAQRSIQWALPECDGVVGGAPARGAAAADPPDGAVIPRASPHPGLFGPIDSHCARHWPCRKGPGAPEYGKLGRSSTRPEGLRFSSRAGRHGCYSRPRSFSPALA